MQFRNFLIGCFIAMLLPALVCAQQATPLDVQQVFQLSTPWVAGTETIFSDKTHQELEFGLEGAVIHYTLDGTEPTRKSTRYTGAIPVHHTCILKARAFHKDYLPSEPVLIRFFKVGPLPEISRVSLEPAPDPAYPGLNAAGLVDRVKGTLNFKSPEWSGFSGEDVAFRIAFAEEVSISRITVSLLVDPAAWIFPPKQVIVSSMEDGEEPVRLAIQNPGTPGPEMQAGFRYVSVEGPFTGKEFLISIRQMEQIPEWHQGKGTAPWLFIDEIIFE